jgi:ABC-type uncharacterized transport system permease subunit
MKHVLSLEGSGAPLRLPALGGSRTVVATVALFLLFCTLFFLALGRAPLPLFGMMFEGSLGSGFALSETLVKASPIVLCALATALPAALGLISVGAEGQLFMGAITGTAFVMLFGDRFGALTLPLMVLCGASGGALYGAVAALLRVKLAVNETISTLLLNYLSPLLVEYLVFGPWKDPNSLGWPATPTFPDAARFSTYFDSRVHGGLLIGVVLVAVSVVVIEKTRLGAGLALLREGPLLAERAGLSFGMAALVVLALGGATAGIAGVVEASVMEGRLQAGVGAGAGYSGFLVAFLARGKLAALLPLAFAVAALNAAGDNLQLAADLPSSVVYVLQGLLFAAALIASKHAAGGEREVAA